MKIGWCAKSCFGSHFEIRKPVNLCKMCTNDMLCWH